jgi:NAD(P)-dependent dehydrogenase (short-subunit alcohol dehydrogenase family)
MARHALVIGGTGMLSAATTELAKRFATVTVVARSTRSLEAIAKRIAAFTTCHVLKLDWSDRAGFLRSITEHLGRTGHPDFVLAWLHHEYLAPDLAEALRSIPLDLRFVHVLSSAAANPAGSASELRKKFSTLPGVVYQQVVLGFVVEAGGSRWLTHSEICDGVLEAIDTGATFTIVGSVHPWNRRT